MSSILIVDDALADRTLVSGIAAAWNDCEVRLADSGPAALDMVAQDPPDLILTDMHMPEMDGLELVTAVREMNPAIPVVLMTAMGSEEMAARALRAGAASYVPKRRLAEDLVDTLRQVVSTAQGERTMGRLMHHVSESDTTFSLFTDRSLIRMAVDHVLHLLRSLPLRDQTERLRVGIALEEALNNAYYHGNLEVREAAGADRRKYAEVAAARRAEKPYSDRRIHLRIQIDRCRAEFRVRDDGHGFDWRPWMSGDSVAQQEGRGIALMRSVMDDVQFSDAGNEVLLRKNRYRDVGADDPVDTAGAAG